jgi:hypothetical protein
MLGTHATELVHIGQAVMTFDGTLDYFLESVFNYPTLAECYKVALQQAAGPRPCTRRGSDDRRRSEGHMKGLMTGGHGRRAVAGLCSSRPVQRGVNVRSA